MDLKALMQKLENINTTQIVTESVETKQVITESKTVVKESAEPVFKSSIARGLVEEFGYELEEATPPAPAASPWANDPAKDAAWKALSPEDQKWLGGADPTDPYILARAPNKGKPAKRATGAVLATPTDPSSGAESDAMAAADQADADLGAAMRANAAGGNSTSAATGVGNPGEEAAAQAAADGAATKPADAPADAGGSINPATLAQYKALLDKLKASQGGAATKPTQIAPAPKPKPAQKTPIQPAVGSPGIKVGTPGAANQAQADALNLAAAGGMGAESVEHTGTAIGESSSYQDDLTILAIKNIRY
jgi:hypothetical protein